MSTLSVTNLKNAASATNNLVLNPDGSVNISGGTLSPQTGFKNRLINPAMVIDQRNAGAATTPSVNGPAYLLDRFFFYNSQVSKLTYQQNAGSVTPPVGFSKYFGITVASAATVGAGDVFLITQAIEGQNVADLDWGTANAATVSLSFWVRSSLTGNFSGALQNSGNTRTYVFSYAIAQANTWEKKTITITGDTAGTWLTNNGIGIALNFSLGAGATFSTTAGSWVAGNTPNATGSVNLVATSGATFYITGVQLERGSVATPFEFRSIGQELALCQRYYAANSGYRMLGVFATGVAQAEYITVPVYMRAAPTVTVTPSSFQNVGFNSAGTTYAYADGFKYTFNTSVAINSNGVGILIWTASAEL